MIFIAIQTESTRCSCCKAIAQRHNCHRPAQIVRHGNHEDRDMEGWFYGFHGSYLKESHFASLCA